MSPSQASLFGLGGYRGFILAVKTTPAFSFSDPALTLGPILCLVGVLDGCVRQALSGGAWGRPEARYAMEDDRTKIATMLSVTSGAV